MSSKGGLHLVGDERKNFEAFLATIRDAGAELPVVHIVGSFGVAEQIKAFLPNTRIIGRKNDLDGQHLGEWQDSWNADPRGAAEDYYAKVKPTWDAHPLIDTWGYLNEANNPFYKEQADFNIRMLELTDKPLCMWNSSVGTPDYWSNDKVPYESVARSCKVAKASELPHVLGLHEYAFVTDLLEEAYKNHELGPHLVLRYRRLATYLESQDALIPIILTEVGQGGGYRFVGNNAWMVDMRWYDSEVRKDDYVESVAWWTLGKWDEANIENVLPEFADYIVAEHTDTPPPDPEPDPPTPEPDECKPRTRYKRTYHYIEHTEARPAPYAHRLAVFIEADKTAGTYGNSLDDACHGPGVDANVILYGVLRDRQMEFKAFKNEYYPHVASFIFKDIPNVEPPEPPPDVDPPIHEPFKLPAWPTDYQVYTQGFGENPEYYEEFGLPGHEGVDIRAPNGTNVYACADGVVTKVGWRSVGHPYGYAIRIKHVHNVTGDADGRDKEVYRTVYAHGQKGSAHVTVGDMVKAGQLIMLAGSTGNVQGVHLHLTFKKDGATASGETNYPHDIMDPTPRLPIPDGSEPPAEPPPEDTHVPVSMLHLAASGLHPNDPNGSFMTDLDMLRDAKMNGFVFTTNSDIDPDALGFLLAQREIPPENVIIRLHMPGSDPNIAKPDKYVELHRAWIRHGLSHGVRKFQLWNEPNLDQSMVDAGIITPDQMEWPHDAVKFAEIYHDVAGRLRNEHGDGNIKIGYPPMSPQDNAKSYYDAAWRNVGIRLPDWYSIHSYFSTGGSGKFGIDSLDGGLYWQQVIDWLPDKFMPIWIAEFADNGTGADIDRAQRTAAYYTKQYPTRIKGLACYISQDGNFPKQEWVSNPHMIGAVRDR